MADLVGGAIARELCLTGRVLSAEEAHVLHVVSRVVALEGLLDATLEVAMSIARAPRRLLMRTKAKALRHAGIDTGTTLDL